MTAFSAHEHTARLRHRCTDVDLSILARCATSLLHANATLRGVGEVLSKGDRATLRIMYNRHRQAAAPFYVKANINGRTFTDCTILIDHIAKHVQFITAAQWSFTIGLAAWHDLFNEAVATATAAHILAPTWLDLGATTLVSQAPRLTAEILAKEGFPTPCNTITLTAGLRDGVAYLGWNGVGANTGLTLIETDDRVRILFAGIREGWVEVPRSSFHELMVLARKAYSADYTLVTTRTICAGAEA